MPIPNFDGLWCIILKLFSENGDHVASQGKLRITVIMLGQLFTSELTRANSVKHE